MSTSANWTPIEGGCPCGTIRYRLEQSPLIVHCCHCRWCQRESGSAFAVNAMVETKFVKLLSAESPDKVWIPSESGAGQQVARCPSCRFGVWSNYGPSGDVVRMIKAGTLDEPWKINPDIQIYTATKLPWVKLDDSIPAMQEYYDREKVWSKSSLERRDALMKSLA